MLYHISEEASIRQFVPRRSIVYPELPPVVWALDEEHLLNYLCPRDCPRIIYSRSPDISEADEKQFFSHTTANTIIAIENAWYRKMSNTRIYKYALPSEGFQLFDANAGYYIATEIIKPVSVEPIDDLIDRILVSGAELRFVPSLYPLRDAILTSSINQFSIIRFRNAISG